MPATVRASVFNGSGPTDGSAEGGVTFGRDDSVISTTVLPIPDADGTFFSWAKTFALEVTGGTATNHITNRKVGIASAMPTGMHLWWKQLGSTYTQAAAPASGDTGSNGSTPTGYSGGAGVGGEVTSTPTQYDNTSVITSAAVNGAYIAVALGVDHLYLGGGGTASLPSMNLIYDEGP